MRHILEHNYEWARVLDNALASFTQRMALILFTPERETTQEIAFQHDGTAVWRRLGVAIWSENRNRRCLLETMVGGALTNSCSSGASFGMTDIIKLVADWSAYCGIAYLSQCNRTAVCVISAGLSGHI
jgi:hypothetical protein